VVVRRDVQPIGLDVSSTGRALARAFDDALAASGGSLPVWLILIALVSAPHPQQRELARAVGIEGATLTHHLHRMEQDGLVTRTRDPRDRRAQVVALTPAGKALFRRLRTTAQTFDARLREGFSERELRVLHALLARLRANVADTDSHT
jgi:MarR family transcriptional regulator for hemolysin